MIGRGRSGRDRGDDGRPGVFRHERILEDLRQFRLTVRYVLRLSVDGANTLLESQEGGVDFRTLGPPLSIVRFGIRPPFRSGQVDEGELALELAAVPVSE